VSCRPFFDDFKKKLDTLSAKTNAQRAKERKMGVMIPTTKASLDAVIDLYEDDSLEGFSKEERLKLVDLAIRQKTSVCLHEIAACMDAYIPRIDRIECALEMIGKALDECATQIGGVAQATEMLDAKPLVSSQELI
jgi:hypothetical protein